MTMGIFIAGSTQPDTAVPAADEMGCWLHLSF